LTAGSNIRPERAVSPATVQTGRAPLTARTALLLVDVLNEFLEEGGTFECPSGRAMVPTLAALISACQDADLPVIYIVQSHRSGNVDRGLTAAMLPDGYSIHLTGSRDVEIYAPLAPATGDVIIDERRHSGFFGTELEIVLRQLDVDTVIVAGVTAPVCCESTVRDAAFRDFHVIYPADLNECNDIVGADGDVVTREDLLRVISAIISFLYGRVTTGADLISEVCRLAGSR
jgi:ureidoacrylate peracid hydrolase